MKHQLSTLLYILSTLLCGCAHQQVASEAEGDTLRLKYAENLTIVRYGDYITVELGDPWKKGRVLHRYVLVADGQTGDWDGTVVKVPMRRVVSFNTAHASLMGMLGATNQLCGVADLKYMQLPEVQRRVKSGAIADCGDGMSPDIERLIEQKADGVLLSPFENSGGYGRLEDLGVPIIECADYMETSALGRAEWMKFYGLLLGKEHEADSLFALVDSAYHVLSIKAQRLESRQAKERENGERQEGGTVLVPTSPRSFHPSMITEKLTGSTWYVPGGQSSVSQLIKDAGGSYAWNDDQHSGSLALPFETVLDKASDADVWIFNDVSANPPTYARLTAEYHGYTQMKAFRRRNVWYVNSLRVPYFEEVSFRPDWLLRDYVLLLHPGLLEGVPKYYKPVEE